MNEDEFEQQEREFSIEVRELGGFDDARRTTVRCTTSVLVDFLEHIFSMCVHLRRLTKSLREALKLEALEAPLLATTRKCSPLRDKKEEKHKCLYTFLALGWADVSHRGQLWG